MITIRDHQNKRTYEIMNQKRGRFLETETTNDLVVYVTNDSGDGDYKYTLDRMAALDLLEYFEKDNGIN